jgi:probable F420-dependent oxidoreductase
MTNVGESSRKEWVVTTLEMSNLAVAVQPGHGADYLAAVAEAERIGYSAIWISGGGAPDLDEVAKDVVRATDRVPVATGIFAVSLFDAPRVAAAYTGLEASHPGRLTVGIGGARSADPFAALNAYLDELDGTVPVGRRVLAAMGPRMLELARDRTAGALPVLVTPDYTASCREVLGNGPTLAVQQLVAITTDAGEARSAGRVPLSFMRTLPAYQRSFRRMGFSADDIADLSDDLVDALIFWGDAPTVAAKLQTQLDAGADSVAVSVVNADPAETVPITHLRTLAAVVGG